MRVLILFLILVTSTQADTLFVTGLRDWTYRFHWADALMSDIDTSKSDTAWTGPIIYDPYGEVDLQIPLFSFELPTSPLNCEGFTVEAYLENLTDDSLAREDAWALLQFYLLEDLSFDYSFSGNIFQIPTVSDCEYGETCLHWTLAENHEILARNLRDFYPNTQFIYVAVQAIPRQRFRVESMTLLWETDVISAVPEEAPEIEVAMSVYPSPVIDVLTYQGPPGKYRLYDILGRNVGEGSTIMPIPFNGLPTGMYFVQIETPQRMKTFPIRKVR